MAAIIGDRNSIPTTSTRRRDCYALAAERREPLLYKGGDFVHTDIRAALPS